MAADTSPVQQLEAPPLTPLTVKSKLAPTPTAQPKYFRTINNAAGQDVIIADPNATRCVVALMDVHAVIGGAACHWGGPAAFAEIMASINAIMFSTQGRQIGRAHARTQ